MLVGGDKIKQVSAICGFDKVGEIFDVVGIDNGAITFRSDFGVGMMSWEEFNQHFEKYIEEIKENKHHPWTGWKWGKSEVFGDFQYKTNQKKVIVKKFDVKAEATCHHLDSFNLNIGLKIALARINVKKAKSNLYKAEDDLNNILSNV